MLFKVTHCCMDMSIFMWTYIIYIDMVHGKSHIASSLGLSSLAQMVIETFLTGSLYNLQNLMINVMLYNFWNWHPLLYMYEILYYINMASHCFSPSYLSLYHVLIPYASNPLKLKMQLFSILKSIQKDMWSYCKHSVAISFTTILKLILLKYIRI